MADIIPFSNEDGDPADDDGNEAADLFLRDEGLELLAAFRAIEDRTVRQSLLHLIKVMARSGRRAEQA